MKKKIAVCANGWNYDSLYEALTGIKEYAAKEDFDTFVFLSFASYSEHHDIAQGELNIYELMDPEDYDGIIVFSTAINSVGTAVDLCRKAAERNVPVVSIGMEIDGIHSVCVSNDEGMRELVTHLVKEHDVKRVFFIGGTPDHVDSIARLRVTREVLKEYGLSLGYDDYGYGKWSNRYTAELIDQLTGSGKKLPDAIICANDIMAMAACTRLEEKGIYSPEDIIVTGFDNCREGKIFYPALSSVKQNYKEIGYTACEIIFDEIRGDKTNKQETVASSFVCGNSCGCGGGDYEAQRILYCRHTFKRNTNARVLEQNERVMRQWMADLPNYGVLRETLYGHYQKNHQFEGPGFHICVNEDFFGNVMVSEKELWEKGSSAGIEVLLSLIDGEIVPGLKATTKTIDCSRI